jgi:hypothetical protein
MHGSNKKCTQDFNQRKLKGRDHLLDLGIDVRIILKLILNE